MYILAAILIFGFLIAIHELGHFIAAKSLGVRVNEFAIGMGPALLKKQGKETLYSLRLLPIGGFCAMEGEDGDSNDPSAFSSKSVWKRFIILVAGSGMNFIAGVLVVMIIFSQSVAFSTNTIAGFMDGFEAQGENGLMVGDKIVEVDGERISTLQDFSLFMSRSNGETVDLVVERDGQKIELKDFPLALKEYTVDGQKTMKYGLYFGVVEATFIEKLKYSLYNAEYFVKLVRIGLTDLIRGNLGVKDLNGPVGIVSTINEVGESSATTLDAVINIAYFGAFIAINLAVMNMLPIPALDGGRIFFMLITSAIEKVTKKKVDPKYEGYIHAMGLVLLMGLMVVVMFNDILRIFNG